MFITTMSITMFTASFITITLIMAITAASAMATTATEIISATDAQKAPPGWSGADDDDRRMSKASAVTGSASGKHAGASSRPEASRDREAPGEVEEAGAESDAPALRHDHRLVPSPLRERLAVNGHHLEGIGVDMVVVMLVDDEPFLDRA
jgi:hypothetical protein